MSQQIQMQKMLSFSHIHSSKRLEFPCDNNGHVDIDSLSERARLNYYFARAMLGKEYLYPQVVVMLH